MELKNTFAIRFVGMMTNIGFCIGCFSLYAISLWIMGAAIWGLIRETSFTNFAINQLLDEVALIVFGIAVMDVVKYLMTEEVLKSESERDTHQTSRSLTKFVIIIATALSLEGLVLTIEVVKTDLRLVIYPAVLFFIATIFIIGLGVYVRVRRND